MLAVAGAREPAGRARCRPVHHGRDGRARDSDVHQQRHPGRECDAPSDASRSSRSAACSRCSPPTCCRRRPRRRALSLLAAARARGAALPLAAVADAARRRSCGSCTWPTAGSSIYLVLRALAALGLVAEPLAVHALTIGAIGGMTIGMMTRTARGHTGRPLRGGPLRGRLLRARAARRADPRLRRHVRCPAPTWRRSSPRASAGRRRLRCTRSATGRCCRASASTASPDNASPAAARRARPTAAVTLYHPAHATDPHRAPTRTRLRRAPCRCPRALPDATPYAVGFYLVPGLSDDGVRRGDRAAARGQSPGRRERCSRGGCTRATALRCARATASTSRSRRLDRGDAARRPAAGLRRHARRGRAATAPLAQWLRDLARRGIAVGGISLGAYALAHAGLLDGRRCALHWENLAAFGEQFPRIRTTTDLFVVDGDRYTCSGGTAALDMMLHAHRRAPRPRAGQRRVGAVHPSAHPRRARSAADGDPEPARRGQRTS